VQYGARSRFECQQAAMRLDAAGDMDRLAFTVVQTHLEPNRLIQIR